jgi:hypothetical protein
MELNAATWANIISSFSAAAAIASAIAAWMQATKSRNAARDAEQALAAILRPEFVPGVGDEAGDEVPVGLSNVARHDALEVRADIRTSDGRKVGEGEIHRVAGHVPNVLSGEPEFRVFARGLPVLAEVGASYDLVIVLHFTDERRMKNWHQELRVTRTLTERNGRTYVTSQNHLAMPTSC